MWSSRVRIMITVNKTEHTHVITVTVTTNVCCAELLPLCPALCDPMNCRPPGSSVRGILQARVLEWVAMPSSRGSSRPWGTTRVSYLSCIGGGFFTTSAP